MGGRPRVLVVEDEPLNADMLEEMLGVLGYEAVHCGDGEAALQTFEADPDAFAAVALDLGIPKKSGRDVLAAIRKLRPEARILVMTGSALDEVEDEMRRLGAAGVLHKPFKMSDLTDALESVLAPQH